MSKKAAIYIRVSTEEQHPENQKKPLIDYCKTHEIDIFKIYIDHGESGRKDSRPAFNDLIKDMRSRLFQIVMVWKLDRIGRSLQHLVKILQEMHSKKIDFISITQGMNTTTAEGKLMYYVIGAFAQYESDLLSERTKRGMERARAEGKHVGRPRKDKEIYNHYCAVSGCRIKIEQTRKLCDKHKKFMKNLQERVYPENKIGLLGAAFKTLEFTQKESNKKASPFLQTE